ncbi:MAG: AraC family transcriptional regulator ligand-binding domain-containing protein [Labilithrix sp.]|nr:AraC family transcriptional regulator ligand-binding domain-containing protein [Labilithrix sp.]
MVESVWIHEIRLVLAALDARRCAAEPILARAGLSSAVLAGSEEPVPTRRAIALWETAARATDDPLFGVHVAEHLAFERRTAACATFDFDAMFNGDDARPRSVGEGLARFVHSVHPSVGPSHVEMVVDQGGAHLVGRSLIPSPQRDEFICASLVLRGRRAAGVDWAPDGVTFQHERGDRGEALDRLFRCPVSFGAEANELRCLPSVLGLAQRWDDASTFGIASGNTRDRWARPPWVARCVATISSQMNSALPSLASTAALLRVTERTLQRRLADSGTSYAQLLDGVRRDRALRLVEDGSWRLARVAFALHFSDESAFHRAFKRWTGRTPGELRQRTAAGEDETSTSRRGDGECMRS